MKLWKKISLICSVILIGVVTTCSAILLGQAQKRILSLTYKQAEDKQRNIARSFQEMANYYFSEDDSGAVKHALIDYCFSRFADSSCILMVDGEIAYSQSSIHPDEYFVPDKDGNQQQFTGMIEGRHILIVGGCVDLSGFADGICAIYIVEDITSVYESITKLFFQFILIGAAGIVIGMLLIIFTVRCSVRPLAKLQSTASRIAMGNYNERTDVRSGDEVGMLAADFNRMADAVERHVNELIQTAQRQKLFIGGVTHEFKTPLTALILNVDSLQNICMDEDERMSALARMEQQCKWLERLVQKMLKLITVNQKIEIKRTPVPELLDKVKESVEESLRARGVRLDIQCRTEILNIDEDLMQSVLVNLVDNAVKASEGGQTVVLAAYDNVLEVRDSGIGIEREELERITEPFYMVDKSRSKKHGGIGLGLALVKEIVKAHNAVLEIESARGMGTTVRVCLER